MRRMLLVGAFALVVALAVGAVVLLGRGGGGDGNDGVARHDPVALRSCLERYGYPDVGERIPGYVDVLLYNGNGDSQRDLVVAYGGQARQRLAVGLSDSLTEWDNGRVTVRGEGGDVVWAATGEAAKGSPATPDRGSGLGGTFSPPPVDQDQRVLEIVGGCLTASRRGIRPATRAKQAERPAAAVTAAGTASRDWLITDLGTLGGNRSAAVAISASGQVVGTATTANEYGDPHAFLWESGTIRDLGTRDGFTSEAVAINDHGQVIGNRVARNGFAHVFLWRQGRMIDIGPASPHYSNAVAVNANGQVIATGYGASAFLWSNGRATDLSQFGTVTAINDQGQVVGDQFLWAKGKTTDIDPTGSGVAVAINESGEVVGNRQVSSEYFSWTRAFLWQNGRSTALKPLAHKKATRAVAINNNGEIIGTSAVAATSEHPSRPDPTHAVVWTQGRVIDLGTLDARSDGSSATAINEHGHVAGWSLVSATRQRAAAEHAFVWRNGKMTDLGTIPGGTYSRAVALNDRDQIVGTAPPGAASNTPSSGRSAAADGSVVRVGGCHTPS